MLNACSSSKKTENGALNDLIQQIYLDTIDVVAQPIVYQSSYVRTHDLLHTKLDVSFDWEKEYLHGKAWLELKPYFYATDQLVLDAKGMDLHKVQLVHGGNSTDVKYAYDDWKLFIDFGKVIQPTERYTIYIEYTAKPSELPDGGNEAITDDRGLYFINSNGTDKTKPTQLWTQGEPEASSCWFPTIDAPNERCSQELYITVNDAFFTMSNGHLINQNSNNDGTRTDYWKQDKPHAPYLFMMAVGNWYEYKDDWNGMSVNYYVDPEYADVADDIFGNTPEMMTFFSDAFDMDYPWDKYWQVCVNDFVSGAMENTSAVIHGDFVQLSERELLDGNYEDIVAHELMHHWFGDLVTCESWANLPLNESFATYGEVMWKWYKYGESEGMLKNLQDQEAYFGEAETKQVELIRYNHNLPQDMFDRHSYEKGSTVLHMLRDIVGDDAFFTSLNLYLNDNKYDAVEIHNLRLAFEEVTGQDLNWFFNQWFLSAGHPELDVEYGYKDGKATIDVKQKPSKMQGLKYRLPMTVDIYAMGNHYTERIELTEWEQHFEFDVPAAPSLINLDPDGIVLAVVSDNKTKSEMAFQYNNAKNFRQKYNALVALNQFEKANEDMVNVFKKALKDDFWYIQKFALENYPENPTGTSAMASVENLAKNAENTKVRAEAIYFLSELENQAYVPLFEKGLSDQSYLVNAASLEGLLNVDSKKALAQAEKWENETNYDIMDVVGYIYSEEGGADKKEYFENLVTTSTDEYTKYYGMYYYSMFLGRMDTKMALDAVHSYESFGKHDEGEYSQNVAISGVRRIANAFNERNELLKQEQAETTNKMTKLELENEIADNIHLIERCIAAEESIKAVVKKEAH